MSGSVIHWFRKGLRLHDNPALKAAIDAKLELYPIFILDPAFVKNANVGKNRWRFLQQALKDLDDQLQSLGSRLFVLRGKPEEVLKNAFKDWKVSSLTYEVDSEPHAKEQDGRIDVIAKENSVQVHSKVFHTLYDLKSIIEKNKGM